MPTAPVVFDIPREHWDTQPKQLQCMSDRRDLFLGAVVHAPNDCNDDTIGVLIQDLRQVPWSRCWRAYRARDGMWYGVNTGYHVVCGVTYEAYWLLEKYEENNALKKIMKDIEKAKADIAHYGGEAIADSTLDDMIKWTPIMRPNTLEGALQWARKKRNDGLTVRLRNMKTGDVIMGDVL